MEHVAKLLIVLIGIEHLFICYMQMTVWAGKKGLKLFHLNEKSARPFQKLAFNQGLYNSFLGLGLLGSFWLEPQVPVQVFFLSCVFVAGIVGGLTFKPSIFGIQAFPAALALALVLL